MSLRLDARRMTFGDLFGSAIECGCGRTHRVHTRQVEVGRGAVASTGPLARRLDLESPVLLVADPETFAAAGADALASLAASGYAVRQFLFGHHPVAGPETIAEVTRQLDDAATLVSVGSGTINDIVKSAADAAGLPFLSVGTALSMNGYTSAISALLSGGVKRTVPTQPAAGVIIDLDVCAAAPLTMTLAGLGDMLSKPFSEADWRLAYHIDGGYHCDRPGSVLDEAFARMLRDATEIGRAKPEALRSLADAILLSGASMAMAGVSSPASGGEHLVSHYWDMICYARDEHPHALHGTQVGVACCLVEPLHHRISSLTADRIDIDASMARWPHTIEIARAQIRARHPALPEDVRERVVAEAEKKWRPPAEQRARLSRLRANLRPVLEHVGGALLEAGAVKKALVDAGAPTRPGQLADELTGDLQRWSHVRDMRARYTVLDLAAELGVLGEVTH